MRVNQDFEMPAGTSRNLEWNVDEDDGSPKDLAGGSATFYLFKEEGQRRQEAVLTVTCSTFKIDGGTGEEDGIRAAVAPDDTRQLGGNVFFYETWAADGLGNDEVVAKGKATILASGGRA